MWVVKLGGSLATSTSLKRWLEVLAQAGGGNAVIVPGGGPFADAVRAAQALLNFDDVIAHSMALLAMEQYGLLLCGLNPALAPAATLAEIADVMDRGRVPVWFPSRMLAREPGIPATWDVTSDSLAAWLARRLNAERLVLVKACAAPEPGAPHAQWVSEAMVDRAFPVFAAGLNVRLLGGDEPSEFERLHHPTTA
jgi:5-(aminomethyl)-3-furanmethanol phosphate kinase